MHASTSFLECDEYTRRLLSRVHAVYFSERQQDLWRTTGYLRLSALLRVCLELGNGGPALFADDLGPQQAGCRETLRFLGIPGTDTHRLPRHDDGGAAASATRDLGVVAGQFQDPAHMEYGCWAMTSTQDLPSLRQWWEEDTSMAWGYFRSCVAPQQIKPAAASDASSPISLAPSVSGFPARRDDLAGSGGGASSTAATFRASEQLPKQCTSEVATAMLRHYCASSAMLVVFPIQDLIAADAGLRHPDPHERINIPALAKHVWRWRIPVTLDMLLSEPGRPLQSKLRLMLQEAARLGDL
jgi:4-alpha-glucanotransferase